MLQGICEKTVRDKEETMKRLSWKPGAAVAGIGPICPVNRNFASANPQEFVAGAVLPTPGPVCRLESGPGGVLGGHCPAGSGRDLDADCPGGPAQAWETGRHMGLRRLRRIQSGGQPLLRSVRKTGGRCRTGENLAVQRVRRDEPGSRHGLPQLRKSCPAG